MATATVKQLKGAATVGLWAAATAVRVWHGVGGGGEPASAGYHAARACSMGDRIGGPTRDRSYGGSNARNLSKQRRKKKAPPRRGLVLGVCGRKGSLPQQSNPGRGRRFA
jgi:hypothetical protein